MTPDERKTAIEATATERSVTLNPPVVHQTLAELHKRVLELEGNEVKGDLSNDFHLKSNALHDQHGEARAKFVEKLVQGSIVEETFIPLFLKYLNEYEIDGSGEPPYDVATLAVEGQALNSPQGTFEQAAYESAGVDVRPSEEKENG